MTLGCENPCGSSFLIGLKSVVKKEKVIYNNIELLCLSFEEIKQEKVAKL
jgi:hypothetical protein